MSLFTETDHTMRRASLALLTLALLPLAGCDVLGIETASAVAAKKEAEGRAIGGACRHADRSIEQCYAMNKRADKAAVFAGWREMNDYMRENQIVAVPSADEPVADGDVTAAAPGAEAKVADPAAKAPAAAGKTKADS